MVPYVRVPTVIIIHTVHIIRVISCKQSFCDDIYQFFKNTFSQPALFLHRQGGSVVDPDPDPVDPLLIGLLDSDP